MDIHFELDPLKPEQRLISHCLWLGQETKWRSVSNQCKKNGWTQSWSTPFSFCPQPLCSSLFVFLILSCCFWASLWPSVTKHLIRETSLCAWRQDEEMERCCECVSSTEAPKEVSASLNGTQRIPNLDLRRIPTTAKTVVDVQLPQEKGKS